MVTLDGIEQKFHSITGNNYYGYLVFGANDAQILIHATGIGKLRVTGKLVYIEDINVPMLFLSTVLNFEDSYNIKNKIKVEQAYLKNQIDAMMQYCKEEKQIIYVGG